MQRRLAASVLLIVLTVAGCLGVIAVRGQSGWGPVYPVAAVVVGLQRAPHAWAGRTILIRGMVAPCIAVPNVPCASLVAASWPANTADPGAPPAIEPLPLALADPTRVLAFMRRVPLLGDLLPAPQVLRWGEVATYRARLQAIADGICGTGLCFEAVLLDAVP
jgi:hypothetical protein